MPTRISERYWNSPGPVQDSPLAPKLLVIYPTEKPPPELPYAQDKTRYAGRVEPADSIVRIDGGEIKVYPGGVFTGLLAIPVGEREVTISAESAGAATTIKRKITRDEREKGPEHWPLKIRAIVPVIPSANHEYWLRPGSKLGLRLSASPGHQAHYKIGAKGNWIAMQETEATYEEGGAYTADLAVDDSISVESLEFIHFRLEGRETDQSEVLSITEKSDFRVKRLPADAQRSGVIEKNPATFLKNEQGFERYGNWDPGTPFPVVEKRGDRISVNFGQGEKGYVENSSAKILEGSASAPTPTLGIPELRTSGAKETHAIELRWKCGHPIASVFYPDVMGENETLTINLIGAADAEAKTFEIPAPSVIRSVEILPHTPQAVAQVRVEFAGHSLWGYGWSMADPQTACLLIRALPSPPYRDDKRPLGGLRIMVDAGHGGTDTGALGPSGLAEADVNLVLAALVGNRLQSLGAVIRQTRREDRFVSLDDRVDAALEFNADLFISVHHNSVAFQTDPLSDHGPKVFYHYPYSEPLAARIEDELAPNLTSGEKPRVLREVFRVNRNISVCPSVLIEGGFVCNPADEVNLRKTETLETMSDAIARGVVKMFERASDHAAPHPSP